MGFFDIPTVKRSPNGILAIILCVVASGVGTIIVGAIDDRGNNKRNVILVGVLQVLATFLLGAGWVWAIVWGVLVFRRSVPDGAPVASTEEPVAAAEAPPAAAPAAATKAPAKKAPAKKAAAKPAPKKAAAKGAKKAAK